MRNRWVWFVLAAIVCIILLYGWSFFPSFQTMISWVQSLPQWAQLLLIASAGAIVFLVGVLLLLRFRLLRQLRSTSDAYKKLLMRNANITFHPLQAKYQIRRRYDSKSKLDRTSVQSVFEEELLNQLDANERIASQLQENQHNWSKYHLFYEGLMEAISTSSAPWYLKYLERTLLQQKRHLQPVIDVEFFVLMTYTSPKGRNHYEKKYRFYTKDFMLQLVRSKEYLERVSTQEYLRAKERSKMTPSIRFKILKRDQYRCQICGASQEDGAKLHIDHIIPVAKGGKSVESNLHVLCDRCNLGKGTKGL